MEIHQAELNKAKIQLMSRRDTAFFTTILFSLVHLWDNNIPTACTNGKYIKFNTKFFMNLDSEERLFLLIHEALHVAFLHMVRLMNRDPGVWNSAADYVINAMLIERGFKMPTDGLYDPQYSGMSVEAVYNILINKPKQPIPWPDLEASPDDVDIAQDVQDILVRAAIQSKAQGDSIGTIPGEIQIFLDNLLKPKLPWHRILQKWLQAKVKNDYSFRKPNRRYFPQHYLPSMFSESIIDLSIFVDASGSVTDNHFSSFVSETASIFKMMKPETITLGQFDVGIRSVEKIKSINALRNIKFTGRGGTNISPVLNWIDTNKPQVILIFTDGEFRFPKGVTKPKSSVIWIIHNDPAFIAPFGKVIHYILEG